MAKKNITLREAIKNEAIMFIGEVNDPYTELFLGNFNGKTHWCLVKADDKSTILYAPKETLSLKSQVYSMLEYAMISPKSNTHGEIETPDFPSGVVLNRDINNVLYDLDINSLPSTVVLPMLQTLGVDISTYSYSTIAVDNSSNVVLNSIPFGYENYDQRVLDIKTDTSKFKNYILSKDQELFTKRVFAGHNYLIKGEAATGKTVSIQVACEKAQVPCAIISFSGGTQEDTFKGTFVPNTKDFEEKQFDFIYSTFSLFFKYGGIIILDEINYAAAEVLNVLNSCLDTTATITLPNGEVIHRSPNFRVVATYNPNYRGTGVLNQALRSRFIDKYFAEPDHDTIMSWLSVNTGYNNTKVLSTIVDKYLDIKNIYKTKNMETPVTYRQVETFLSLLLESDLDSDAVESAFLECFVDKCVDDVNDISIEYNDILSISKPMIEEIKSTINIGFKETKTGSWSCQPEIDLDDLDNLDIEDDGSISIN